MTFLISNWKPGHLRSAKVSGRAYRLGLTLILASSLNAELCAQTVNEYQVKAAFLYNFAKFVEWPDPAFAASFGPAAAAAERQPPPPIELTDLPVLVVDDNPTNRSILRRMVTRWGMKPTLAESGLEALSTLESAASSGLAFSLILLAQQMPDMDGFEFVERLRQKRRQSQSIIMMLTSAGQQGDAARSRKLGVAAYLTKPIRQSELRAALLRVLGTQHQNRVSLEARSWALAGYGKESGPAL